MYINTISKDELISSVLEVLNISSNELDELIETCYEKFQKNHHVFILDNQYDYFFDYVKKHLCKEIDQVLFIHVSRRLDDSNSSCGLKELLSYKNCFTSFLSEHKITFKYNQLFIDDKEYEYDESEFIDRYLKKRFKLDYDLKGFVFGDVIDSEPYEYVPDIINYLDNIVDVSDDYIEKSICYEFTYAACIDDIYFEGYEDLSCQDKQYHIVTKALQHLYFYKYDESFIYEEECYIGLNEGCCLNERQLIKEDYIKEMIITALNFYDVSQDWLQQKQSTVKHLSYEKYSNIVQKHLSYFKDKDINELKENDI